MELIDDNGVVVSDAGPLIHLDELGCLDLLDDMSPVLVPELVFQESRRHRPKLQLDCVPGLRIVPGSHTPSPRLSVLVKTLDLDSGEIAALGLAEQHPLKIFLTDDSAARLAAESLGFRAHGTLGLLVRSIRCGLRTQLEVLDILRTMRERSTLHIARNLLAEVITRVSAD
jgi:predicted nucleic acid-binding protein